jgi:hypothetical protein
LSPDLWFSYYVILRHQVWKKMDTKLSPNATINVCYLYGCAF